MSPTAVVESSPLAPRLAQMLKARLIPDATSAKGNEALVMVATTIADVRAVTAAVSAGQTVAVAVAWHLPEWALVQLLEQPVPCLIGEPKPKRLRDVVSGAAQGVNASNERALAARYAVIESLLERPPREMPEADEPEADELEADELEADELEAEIDEPDTAEPDTAEADEPDTAEHLRAGVRHVRSARRLAPLADRAL